MQFQTFHLTKEELEWCFQNYALFPHMTVYENLAFPLRVRKIPKDEADKKIDKASINGITCKVLKQECQCNYQVVNNKGLLLQDR